MKISIFNCYSQGHDRVNVELADESGKQRFNELRHFLKVRQVSASEDLWWLYGTDIVNRSPAVVQLGCAS